MARSAGFIASVSFLFQPVKIVIFKTGTRLPYLDHYLDEGENG